MSQEKFEKSWFIKRKREGASFGTKEILLSNLNDEEKDDVREEVDKLTEFNHPNILKCEQHFIADDKLCVVMEYADGGDLDHLVQKSSKSKKNRSQGPGLSKLTEEEIMRYFCQLCCAVRYLHSKNIVHRNIKSTNVFLTSEGVVKLGGFKISTMKDDAVGTPETSSDSLKYYSPEMCKSLPFGSKADVWSSGVLLYYLTMSKYPFEGDNKETIVNRICEGKFEPLPGTNEKKTMDSSKYFTQGFISLLDHCLDVNVDTRYDVIQILSTPIVKAALEKTMEKEIIKLPLNEREEELKRRLNEVINLPPSIINDFNLLHSLSKHALRNIVTQINLNFKNLTKEDAIELSKSVLPYCEKLSVLYLGSNPDIGDEGATAVVKALSSNQYIRESLTELGLWGDKITDKGAAAVAAVLPRLRHLTKLFLHCNIIKDKGAEALAKQIPKLEYFIRLDIDRNYIHIGPALALAEALSQRKNSTMLHIYDGCVGYGEEKMIKDLESVKNGHLKVCLSSSDN